LCVAEGRRFQVTIPGDAGRRIGFDLVQGDGGVGTLSVVASFDGIDEEHFPLEDGDVYALRVSTMRSGNLVDTSAKAEYLEFAVDLDKPSVEKYGTDTSTWPPDYGGKFCHGGVGLFVDLDGIIRQYRHHGSVYWLDNGGVAP